MQSVVNMASNSTSLSKHIRFACDRCKRGKRKCDAKKPSCSLCERQGRQCVYTESPPRKRKYWDEEYVHGLEAQVQSLLSVLHQRGDPEANAQLQHQQLQQQQPVSDRESPENGFAGDVPDPQGYTGNNATSVTKAPENPETAANDARSQQAMDELCVMLWRTNVGDGVTIINDSDSGNPYTLDEPSPPKPPMLVTPSKEVLDHCSNPQLIDEFARLFLDNINQEHQFTPYTTTSFLAGYPYQPMDDAFLHSALIAVGCSFSTRPEAAKIGDDFASFAESLVFPCSRQPSIKVIQGLCLSSWRSLALGRDHLGWCFESMAAGICVHLRLHVLALDECDARRLDADDRDIRAFWMFYIIDRTSISILGRNCALPWRRINVPSFESTVASTASLEQISFAAQCELWYSQDTFMDLVFSRDFDTQSSVQQIHALISSQESLRKFHRSINPRLRLCGDNTPKAALLFHLAYHMAILITMPPFVRVFANNQASPNNPKASETRDLLLLALRSLTSASTATVRLIKMYRKIYGFTTPPNPVIIHHLLSAGIVHLMNATGQTENLRTQSTYWIRQCLELMKELRLTWPNRADRSIKVLQVLAQRWKVTSHLPMSLSHAIEPNNSVTQDPAMHYVPPMTDVYAMDAQMDSVDWMNGMNGMPTIDMESMDSILTMPDAQNVFYGGGEMDAFLPPRGQMGYPPATGWEGYEPHPHMR